MKKIVLGILLSTSLVLISCNSEEKRQQKEMNKCIKEMQAQYGCGVERARRMCEQFQSIEESYNN